MPTNAMRMNRIIIEAAGGTPSHISVFPWNKAESVTAKAKPRMAKEARMRNQKNNFWGRLRTCLVDLSAFLLILEKKI